MIVAAAGALLAAAMILHGIEEGRLPLFGRFETLGYYCLALTVFYLIVVLRYKVCGLSIFVTPCATLLAAVAAIATAQDSQVDLAIHSVLLDLHIATAITGYAMFTLGGVIAIAYLLQSRNLKRKRFGRVFDSLPSLETLDRIMQRQIGIAFVVFTISLILGVRLAHQQEWDIRWLLDPKIVATAMTWLIYAILFYLHVSGNYHGRNIALVVLIGFACVLFSVAGVRAMSETMHDFSIQANDGGTP